MSREVSEDKKKDENRFQAWLCEKKKQGKSLRKDQMLIVLLSGVLLLVIAFPIEGGKDKADIVTTQENKGLSFLKDEKEKDSGSLEALSGKKDIAEITAAESYVSEMEDKLERALFNMEQVGRVEVLITLKSSEEKIVEKDTPVNRSDTVEQDSGGGNRSIHNVDTKETTIYETDSGKSTPYVVKTTSPQVEGVVVVCEGAGIGNVNKNITDAIEVLFGIEPHKIKVVKMKTS